MSGFIQKPRGPAINIFASGFAGCGALSDDSLRIKFGDFDVQVMDNDKVIVYLDDLIFVDGLLVEGFSGLPAATSSNNNNNLDEQQDVQEQHLQESEPRLDNAAMHELRETVILCNETIADLVEKKLLKFKKSQRGIFQKQSVNYHRERDDVIRVLNRLNEQSREVVTIHDDVVHQLKIKQRHQTILEKALTRFGKQIHVNSIAREVMKANLVSMTTQCQGLENQLKDTNLRWTGRLDVKEVECRQRERKEADMTRLLEKKNQALDDVTAEFNEAKLEVTSLKDNNQHLMADLSNLKMLVDETECRLQRSLGVNEKLGDIHTCLESGVKVLEENMTSQRQFFSEREKGLSHQWAIQCQHMENQLKDVNSKWAGRLAAKELDCRRHEKKAADITQLLKEKTRALDVVTAELDDARGQMTSLMENNQHMKTDLSKLHNIINETECHLQRSLGVNEKLGEDKACLEAGVKILEKNMISQRQFFCEQEKTLNYQWAIQCHDMETQLKEVNSRWAGRLAAKELECRQHETKKADMVQILKEKSHALDVVIADLNDAKEQMSSLMDNKQHMKTDLSKLQQILDDTESSLESSLGANEKLVEEKACLKSSVYIIEEKLISQRQFFCEQETIMRERFEGELLNKDRKYQRFKEDLETMTLSLDERNQKLDDITAELSNTKEQLDTLQNNKLRLKNDLQISQNCLEKTEKNLTRANAELEARIQCLESCNKDMAERMNAQKQLHQEETKVIREKWEEETTWMKEQMASQIKTKDDVIQSLQLKMKVLGEKLHEQETQFRTCFSQMKEKHSEEEKENERLRTSIRKKEDEIKIKAYELMESEADVNALLDELHSAEEDVKEKTMKMERFVTSNVRRENRDLWEEILVHEETEI